MKKINIWLIILIILGLLIRILVASNQQVLETDGPDYIASGVNLINGNGYTGIEGLVDLWFPPLYPIVIGIGSLLFNNLELLSRHISILFGVLLIPLIYLLSKKLFKSKLEAILIASLVAFYPALTLISTITYADSLYIFIIYSFILFSYLALTTRKFYYYIISGALIALSYLTRHEGAGYLILFLIVLFAYNLRKVGIKKLTFLALITILAFLVISMPYLIFLHKETGKWTLTGKTNVIMNAREENIYSLEYEKDNYELNKEKTNLEIYEKKGANVSYKDFITKDFILRYLKNLKINFIFLLELFPLLILTIFGMVTRFNKTSLYLILIFLYSVLLYPIFFVDERYLAPIIPILIIFALFGLFDIMKLIGRKEINSKIKIVSILILCLLFIISNLFINVVLDEKYGKANQPLEQKEAGLWLMNYEFGSTVMARKPWVAFYSNSTFVKMPFADYNNIIKYACYKNVKYLVIDERYIKELRPQLSFLLEEGASDLNLVYENKANKYKIIIYELKC